MWTRKHIFIGIAALVVLEICVQLLYPYDRAVPLARVGPVRAGFSSRSDLARIFQEQFEGSKIELTSGDKTIILPIGSIGMSLNNDSMAARLTEYPFWQRLIPLSLIAKQPHLKSFYVTIDGKQFSTQKDLLAEKLSFAPTNADLSFQDGKLIIGAAKDGQVVTGDALKHALIGATYYNSVTKITVTGKRVQPDRSNSDVAVAKQQAEAILARPITIKVTGRPDYVPDAPTRASWLSVDLMSKPAVLSIDREAIKKYVTKLNSDVQVNAEPVRVELVDGAERTRSGGKTGLALDIDAISQEIDLLLQHDNRLSTIEASPQPVGFGAIYSRSYTNSEAGLRAYVDFVTRTQNVRVVVQQLDGAGWSASGRADESIPSASTYKLFVMLRVFDEINANRLTWDAPMLDTTAGGCFERTIVPSTNPCAEEWIRQFGRPELTDYIHGKGFSRGTGFTFSDATHTTAGDLAKYLIGLHNGTLVSGSNRDMLLEKMSRQLYRTGVPSGVKGWTQDKVGFLWDYIHDAAIVHNPKGNYVVVVMTKGYSYGHIAGIARQIDNILYP